MDKAAWRAHFKLARARIALDARQKADEGIAQRVRSLPEYASCSLLLPYLSFGDEIDTRALIRSALDADKAVALPRCMPGTRLMRWYQVESLEGLEKSSFGVEEPPVDARREVDVAGAHDALALVPGLSFDPQGFRMGYGGGFYDSFLEAFPGVSAGLCREAQMVDALPALEAHDLPVGLVVTEERVIRRTL